MGAAGKPRTAIGAAIAIAAIAGIGFALYAGMGSVVANAKPETDTATEDFIPTGMPEILETTEFNDDNFGVLYENFDAFASSDVHVKIAGQIVGDPWIEDVPEQTADSSKIMSFQMYQGKNILDYHFVSVSYDLGQSAAVDTLDCVQVAGTVQGYRVFTDQHGPYTLPNIVDAKVERLDCIDYLYHAKETIIVGMTETHGGISVTLEKVEFAQEHTRAYLSVSNANPDPINFLEGARIAYQGHHHFTHLEGAPNVHMPEIHYTVMPGEVQHGIVLFKPLDYTHDSKFKFAAKNGYDSYVFTFEVPSPVHHGEAEGHGEEQGHEETEEEHAPEGGEHEVDEEHAAADEDHVAEEHTSDEEHAAEPETSGH
jgi:hypothetical protein